MSSHCHAVAQSFAEGATRAAPTRPKITPGVEDDRADDPVAKVGGFFGRPDGTATVIARAGGPHTVDGDLCRLIAAAEAIGVLDTVAKARVILAGLESEDRPTDR